MKLSKKIAIIFCTLIMLGVVTTGFALREMHRLTAELDADMQLTIPLRDALVILQNQVDNMFSIKQHLLSPHLTFAERWAYLQQYRVQSDTLLVVRNTVNTLLAQDKLPQTTQLWEQLQIVLQEGKHTDAQMEGVLHLWFSTGIARPDRFENLLLQFESDQNKLLTELEKMFLQHRPANPHTPSHPLCRLQQWLDRIQESAFLYSTGAWDGVLQHRFPDGSFADEVVKNDAIVTQLNALRAVHTRFHQSLEAAESALNKGERARGVTLLKSSKDDMERMHEYFAAIRKEVLKTAVIAEEAQGIREAERDYQVLVQQAMTHIITANFEEISAQEKLAVESVGKAIYRIKLLLGLFIALSLGLGFYTFAAYKRNQQKVQHLELERQAAFEQMHFLFNTFPMGCMVRDSEFHLRNCNQAAARLFGIEEEWEQMEENALAFGLEDKWAYLERYSDLIYPKFQPDGSDSRKKAHSIFTKAFETGHLKTEWVYEASDGSPVPAEVTLVRTEWEGAPAIVYHIRDLREEKALRAKEEEANEYSRVLFEEVPMGCVIRDVHGVPLICNKTMCTLIGARDKEDFLAHYTEIVPKFQPCGRPSTEMLREKLTAALQTGYQHFEWMHQRLDGELLPVDVVLVRVTLHGRSAVACYSHDMRAIKGMMLERDKANLHIRTLFDNAPFSCHIRDSWGNIRDCNAETLRMFGLNSAEEFYELFPRLSPATQADGQRTAERFTTLINTAFETGYEVFQWVHLRSDGQPFAAEITLVRIAWDGNPALACYIRPRVTENRNAVRYTITLPCYGNVHMPDGTSERVRVLDVSLTGVCLRGNTSRLELNQLVAIYGETPPFDAVLHGVQGYVCRVADSEAGVMLTTPLTHNLPLVVRQFNDSENVC